MIINENNSMPYMKSLTNCLNHMISDGYSTDFRITDNGLESVQNHFIYQPDEVRIENFFRFEGESDPADNMIMYVIATSDGNKGTLVDAFGPYHDTRLTLFMQAVDNIRKK